MVFRVAETLGKFVWEVESQMSFEELNQWGIYFNWKLTEQKRAASMAKAKQAAKAKLGR